MRNSIVRKVVDSNILRDESLEQFLAKSSRNYAVICDYVSMEAYKDDALKSIFPSMEILSRYPKQVIVLKGTAKVCGLKARGAGLQNRLIDKSQTSEFPKFCAALKLAKKGDSKAIKSILDHQKVASEHMDLLTREFSNLSENLEELMAIYTENELRIIRRGDAFSEAIIDKIIQSIIAMSGFMFQDHPNVNKLPKFEELTNTYIFRNSLMMYIAMLDWMSVGGLRNIKPEKIRNDMVDAHIATYATFFNGIMTKEKRVLRRYELAKALLEKVFDTKVNK